MSTNDPTLPKAYALLVAHGSSFGGDNQIDFSPKIACFVQIVNYGPNTLAVQLNGDDDCIFTMASGDMQIFNPMDAEITLVDFAATVSASDTATSVQVLAGVKNG